jgi:DNA replication protein DnaC
MAICNVEGAIKAVSMIIKRINPTFTAEQGITTLEDLVTKFDTVRNNVKDYQGANPKGEALDIYMSLEEIKKVGEPTIVTEVDTVENVSDEPPWDDDPKPVTDEPQVTANTDEGKYIPFKGDVINYKGKPYVVRNINSSDKLQLTSMDGKNFSGTPDKNSTFEYIKSLPLYTYKDGNEYILDAENNKVYGLKGETNHSNLQKKAMFEGFKSTKKVTENVSKDADSYPITDKFSTNEGQTAAINKMKNWFVNTKDRSFMLLGRGGTGKTTVINVLLKQLNVNRRDVYFAAPTNKAVKVLREANKSNDYKASGYYTVARLLNIKAKTDSYGNAIFERDLYAQEIPMPKVLVVDEASMLNSSNYVQLVSRAKRAGTRIIFMGDTAQLPPVRDNKSPIRATVFAEHESNSFALTELMRQDKDSPIVTFTDNLIRKVDWVEGKLSEAPNRADAVKRQVVTAQYDGAVLSKFDKATNEGTIFTDEDFDTVIMPKFIEDYKKDPKTTKYIHFNKHTHSSTVRKLNQIRAALYGEKADTDMYIPGEPLMLNSGYQEFPGEPDGILDNGEEFTVVRSSIVDEKVTYAVGKKLVSTKEPMRMHYILATDNVTGAEHLFRKPILNDFELSKFIEREKNNLKNQGINKDGAHQVKSALALDLSYGYIINAHRSQGSTYRTVYMDLGNIVGQSYSSGNDSIKSLYVAASRASKKLVVINNGRNSTILNPVSLNDPENKPKVFNGIDDSEANDIIKKIDECNNKGNE